MLDGVSRRFARCPPTPNELKMKRFKIFVAKWLRNNLTPLSNDVDTSFETWIANTPYPKWRKDDLRFTFENTQGEITAENAVKNGRPHRHCRVNSFQKDETYPTYKPARAINSRTDAFKVRVGPIFKLIEKELFSLPYFIKHTPCDERAEEIKRELYQAGANIIGTDYTAFEALFTKELMMTCEMQLYSYMTQNIDDQEWYHIVEKTLTGKNYCTFRNKFTAKVQATRMSGEMCTSLGNSFTNLMAMLFIAEENKLESLRGRVEGDDGIFTFYGPYPTSQDFADIGLLIKIDKYDTLTEGSFCGIIADEDEMINVTDPINTLLDFGWTTRIYAEATNRKLKSLLRSKALSVGYQYPGCPILASLAQYGMRVTNDVKADYSDMNSYEKDLFIKMRDKFHYSIPHKDVGFKTRLLVEKRYGISVQDQILIESYLDSKTDLTPIDCPAILSYCNADAKDYYERYSELIPIGMVSKWNCDIAYNNGVRNFINPLQQYEQVTNHQSFATNAKNTKTYRAKRPHTQRNITLHAPS